MGKKISILFILLLIFSISGCKIKQGKITLRLAEDHPSDYPTTLGDYEFAKLVKERTNGRVNIEVYPNKQLGEEISVIEQVQKGTIDITRVSISPVTSFDDKFNALQMPYLYKDDAQMWKVLNGSIGDSLLKDLEKAGFIGIGWFDGGIRNFYTKKPVKHPKDLTGMKIRVQHSELMIDMVEALGAKAIPLSLGDVTSSLQIGNIDGAENNYPSYDSENHYLVAKFYIEDEHTRVPEIIIANKKAMESKLTKKEIQILKQAAKDSQPLQIKLWAEKVKISKEKVIAAKCIITALTPEGKKEFETAMQPVYDKQAKEVKEIVKKIKDVQ